MILLDLFLLSIIVCQGVRIDKYRKVMASFDHRARFYDQMTRRP